MVLYEGATTTLDHLVQKSLRYKHHKQNYIRSLNEGIIPAGFHINKKPPINTVPSDFHNNWKTIISKAEKDLVRILLVESHKIVAKIDFEIQSHIKEYHPNNYDHEYGLIQKKHNNKKELSKRRNKKWKKFKEKQTSESKKLESKGKVTKSLGDSSSNFLIKKEEFSTSKVTEQNESADIALESLAKNVTNNSV